MASMEDLARRMDQLAASFQRLEARLDSAPAPGSSLRPIRARLEAQSRPASDAPGSPALAPDKDVYSTEEEAKAKRARPAMYPHTPRRRLDTLEMAARKYKDSEALDFLQLKEMQGFYNLAAILLVFSVSYIVLRNVVEHGFRQDPIAHFLCPQAFRDAMIAGGIITTAVAFSMLVFLLQRAVVSGWMSPSVMLGLYAGVQCLSLTGAVAAVYLTPIGPLPAAGSLCMTMVLNLKSHSFVATNLALARERVELIAKCRASDDDGAEDADTEGAERPPRQKQAGNAAAKRRRRGRARAEAVAKEETAPASDPAASPEQSSPEAGADGADDDAVTAAPSRRLAALKYPGNVTPLNFAYFLACPSLVYEPYFPRTKRRRWKFIFRKSLEMLACFVLEYALLTQFLLPVLAAPSPYGPLMEIAKLAMPSMAMWLVGFYAIFHCMLGVAAELLLYADARFYDAWWSATSLDAFWRLWNKPVHEFLLRHVYVEGIHYARWNKGWALFAVFLISAVAHEIVFSASFKTARPWFALGMLAQMPLIALSKRFKGSRRGNFVVWFSLFLGQPLIEILYFREWMATKKGQFFCVD
ncbi:hypothetical protein FNF27_00105 [Cafeteria roenbergensis]|uniref:O-acyltransferase n=2 Tax=Cafeteria roenbergensis TaxID=33653 RepID=A0A5A8EL57_CAFRO|nr:hypothetical protein FNF27_00105 [Cafeteria roenbergensis]